MVVVVDTNVLVSGLLSAHGAPARVLDLLTTGDLQAVYDDRIAAEYRQVLARERFGFHPGVVGHLLDYLFSEGIAIVARPLPALLPDPGDQPFWEAAVEAVAPLITGNLKHFPTEVCTGIEVLAQATFIDWWRASRR